MRVSFDRCAERALLRSATTVPLYLRSNESSSGQERRARRGFEATYLRLIVRWTIRLRVGKGIESAFRRFEPNFWVEIRTRVYYIYMFLSHYISLSIYFSTGLVYYSEIILEYPWNFNIFFFPFAQGFVRISTILPCLIVPLYVGCLTVLHVDIPSMFVLLLFFPLIKVPNFLGKFLSRVVK